jgi:hypothetical protein
VLATSVAHLRINPFRTWRHGPLCCLAKGPGERRRVVDVAAAVLDEQEAREFQSEISVIGWCRGVAAAAQTGSA